MRSSDAVANPQVVTEMFAEPGESVTVQTAPDAVSDETTAEELAVDSNSSLSPGEHSAARPTTDVPVPRLVIEEKKPRSLDEEENVFGEVDYDDEDYAEGEIELGFISDGDAHPDPSTQASDHAAKIETAAEQATPEVNMDDLLDFSTPIADSEAAEAASRAAEEAEIAGRADIRTVLDEAFNGVKVPELPPQAPPLEEILARRAEAEANFEAIAEEESQMQSGVYPIANLDDDVAPAQKVTAQESGTKSSVTGVDLSPNLLQSLDATISVNESSFKALNEHDKKEQMKQHVGEEGFVIPRGIERPVLDSQAETAPQTASHEAPEMSQEMTTDFQNPLEAYASSQTSKETVSMDLSPISVSGGEPVQDSSSVKPFGSLNRKSVAGTEEEPASADDEDIKSSDDKTADPSQGGASGDDADAEQKEDPQDRLKSGEWQIVYKLQGSLADVFLSEEAEPDMPRMRPRLTEIDSIIPSSIAKLTKGDDSENNEASTAAEGGNQEDEEDATKAGDKKQSDKPVIKPVSNNYYRNDKSGNAGDDSAD
jgi:hypothetical protein